MKFVSEVELEGGKKLKIELDIPLDTEQVSFTLNENQHQMEAVQQAESAPPAVLASGSDESSSKLDDNFKIFIKNPNNKRFALDVKPSTTVKDIKTLIAHHEGIDSAQQSLSFDDQSLKDDQRTLIDYNIQEGATLDLIQLQKLIRIHVKPIINVNNSFVLEIGEDATVEDLMLMIKRREGLTVYHQVYLLLCGTTSASTVQLDIREHKLSEYGVGQDSMLNLIVIIEFGENI